MTFEELKAVMDTKHVRGLEIKLRQGRILKSNIEKLGDFYSFEFLLQTKCGRRIIAGTYGNTTGIQYISDMSMSHAQMLFDWAKS